MLSKTSRSARRRMNLASMGEMPPSTFGREGFTCDTAAAAPFTISARIFHSGSSSKFQCDLLFGSFQNMTASTTGNLLVEIAADVDFFLGVIANLEARAPQHGFHASSVRDPPIRRVAGVLSFDEMHSRKVR